MGRHLLAPVLVAVLLAGVTPASAQATERIAVQPDGKIIVAGRTVQYESFLARLNPDGRLDPTFGEGGIVIDRDLQSPAAVAIQPDGKIVVAAAWSVWRYEADGTPDQQFGSGGVATQSTGTEPVAVEILPDGRIVVAANYSLKIVADDAIAYVYSPDGKSVATLGQVEGGKVSAITLQQDGGIVMAGRLRRPTGKGLLARFVPGSKASYDERFGAGSGLLALSHRGEPLGFTAIAAERDRLYVAGRSARRAVVASFSADGLLDQGFGSQGFATADTGTRRLFVPRALGTQDGGTIVVAGERALSPGRSPCQSCWTPQLLRLTSAGNLDTTFGGAGAAGLSNPDQSPYRAHGDSLALLPSGSSLIAGDTVGGQRGVVVASFDASGGIDSSFGEGGIAGVVPCPGAEAAPVRRDCPPVARVRLRARNVARGKPTLSLHVTPNAPWATIESVRLDFPGMLWVRPSRLGQIEAVALNDGSRSDVDLRKGTYNTLKVVTNGPARAVVLRLPPGVLRRTKAIRPGGRLALSLQVAFGGGEGTDELQARSGD